MKDKKKTVRKKCFIKFMGIVLLIMVCIFLCKAESNAGERGVKSKGNLTGFISFYSEDLEYLEGEKEWKQVVNAIKAAWAREKNGE